VYLYLKRLTLQHVAMSALNVAFGPLALFALVASITPGPNNLLLMRSGATFGVRRSLWHLLGVQTGFAGLVVLAHIGVAALLLALPGAFAVLRWACFAYLMWLAWLIFQDARPRTTAANAPRANRRPMNFLEGMSFQLINPKAWMMAVTVASAFYGSAAPRSIDLAAATLLCMCIGGPSMFVWLMWGASLDHVLKRPRARLVFGYGMSALVAATAVWMLR
jgi:threonine/homoserine/homoserine lactone efflux protein